MVEGGAVANEAPIAIVDRVSQCCLPSFDRWVGFVVPGERAGGLVEVFVELLVEERVEAVDDGLIALIEIPQVCSSNLPTCEAG